MQGKTFSLNTQGVSWYHPINRRLIWMTLLIRFFHWLAWPDSVVGNAGIQLIRFDVCVCVMNRNLQMRHTQYGRRKVHGNNAKQRNNCIRGGQLVSHQCVLYLHSNQPHTGGRRRDEKSFLPPALYWQSTFLPTDGTWRQRLLLVLHGTSKHNDAMLK